MPYLKLVKLIYLLDRKAMEQWGVPVVGGKYFSMKLGPMTEELLDIINFGDPSNWSKAIGETQNYAVAALEDPGCEDLSPAEQRLMEEVWKEFGSVNKWDLCEWTHENLPEWEQVAKGRRPLPVERVGKALSFSRDELNLLSEQAQNSVFLSNVFA